MREQLLSGGRTTLGVVRIGDTVHRPAQPNSELARALLRHLEKAGFGGAPRFLGIDEKGRDCLNYIEGTVPAELELFSDRVISSAAALIRSYHDATRGLAAEADVICHNDLSPCNFVFVDGLPAALIDFDSASPGTRLWDLGYAAWLWLDIGDESLSCEEQARRLRLFVRAYDPELAVLGVIEAMIARQRLLAAEPGDSARSAWASDCLEWTRGNFANLAPTLECGP